jgi:tripartite-type tricarboxylate transporter receptor subunit TctC
MSALAAGQFDYMCDQVANGVVDMARGSVRALAVAGDVASAALPGVPTAARAGLPAFNVSAWNAMFAPKGTPQAVLDKLAAALDKALTDPTTRKRLSDLGCDIPEPSRRGRRALSTHVESEIHRWAEAINAASPRSPAGAGKAALGNTATSVP